MATTAAIDLEEDVAFSDTLSVAFVDELFKTCITLNDKHLLQLVLDIVKDNYLPDEVQKQFLKELKVQFKVEGHMPTFGTMHQAFSSLPANKNRREILTYLDGLKDIDELEVESAVRGLENFVRQSMFIQLYDEVGEMYNKGQKRESYNKFVKGAEAMAQFTLSSKRLSKVFGDFGSRNAKRMAEANSDANDHIPTGIQPLDKKLHGGPVAGDFVCWLGDAKAGKSFALSQAGMTAARLGYPVLHVQAEDTEAKTMARYDSAWMGITYHEIVEGDIPDNRYRAYTKLVKALGKGEIYVYAPEKFGAITVPEIRQQVLDLRKQGINIKVLVVDYWDLINPDNQNYKASDERYRQRAVGQALKDLAIELGLVIHTATQASSVESELLNDEGFVLTREHLAEDKGKVRTVNTLITINATREEKKLNICRLFIEASREMESGHVIKIKRNLKHSRFYDHDATNKMRDEELPDEEE